MNSIFSLVGLVFSLSVRFGMTMDDVHLAYGRTMNEIQRFEWVTVVGVGLVKVADSIRATGRYPNPGSLIAHVEEKIRELDARERTLASMFKRLYESARERNSVFDSILSRAQRDRNHIAHSFLLTVDFKNPQGCGRAVAELSDVEQRFRRRYGDTKKVIADALLHVGISRSNVDHIYALIDRQCLESKK